MMNRSDWPILVGFAMMSSLGIFLWMSYNIVAGG